MQVEEAEVAVRSFGVTHNVVDGPLLMCDYKRVSVAVVYIRVLDTLAQSCILRHNTFMRLRTQHMSRKRQ